MASSGSKRCTGCRTSKALEAFARKRSVRQSQCKECHRQYAKDHYRRNKALYLAKNEKARRRKKEFLLQLKQQPCTDCGKTYPHFVMEFDHLHSKWLPASQMRSHSWRKLREEIAKCEVVCANCHAVRTWMRRKKRVG